MLTGLPLADLVARAAAPGADRTALREAIEASVLQALRRGQGATAIEPLRALLRDWPGDGRAWWLFGVLLHDAQRHHEALLAMARAADLDPQPSHLLGRAQLCYETGHPAADQFAALHQARPQDPQLVRVLCGALQAEGRRDAALALLADITRRAPDWLEGHRLLASVRQTAGDPDFAAGYAAAVAQRPQSAELWLAWFHLLAQARRWDDARAVVEQGEQACPGHAGFASALLYLQSESGAADHQPDLLAGLADTADPGLNLLRVRHALRSGEPAAAAAVALRMVTEASPVARLFWPYLATAWRVLGDARAAWIDQPEALVAVVGLGLPQATLQALADCLRAQHALMAAPYLEQSVRGGTQTDRPVLFRHEPVMAEVREAILVAVRRYVDGLPVDPAALTLPLPDGRTLAHPLLADVQAVRQGGAPLRFAGSWSVRLSAQGYHSVHTHPQGWISSACYVALPAEPGPAPAGYLRLGEPPPELGLDLAPYREIAPQPGQLVLFPSTLWHGTVPFADGERLSLAFDIAPPSGGRG